MATLPWLRLQRPSQSQPQQQLSQSQPQQQPSSLPSVPSPVTERPSVLRPMFRPISQPARPSVPSQPTQSLPLPPLPSQIPLSSSSVSVASPKTLQVSSPSPPITRSPSHPSSPQTRPTIPSVATPPITPQISPSLPLISGVASLPASPQVKPPPLPLEGNTSPPISGVLDLPQVVPTPPSPIARLPRPHSPIIATPPIPDLALPPPPSPIVTTRVPASPLSYSPNKPPTPSPLHHGPAENNKAPEVFAESLLRDYPPRSLRSPDEETLLLPPSIPSVKLPAPLSPVLDRNIAPEAEQKNVLYHKKSSVNNGKDQDSRRKKAASNGDDVVRMITLAGENRGAFMEIMGSKQRSQGVRKDTHAIDGRLSNDNGKKEGRSMMDVWQPMRAFANSNVQGINNSIILSSSCNYHDPGVHLSLSRKPVGDVHSSLHSKKEDHSHVNDHLI